MFPESEVLEDCDGFDILKLEQEGSKKKSFLVTLLRRSDNISDRVDLKLNSFFKLKRADECLRVHKSKLTKDKEKKDGNSSMPSKKGVGNKKCKSTGQEELAKVSNTSYK